MKRLPKCRYFKDAAWIIYSFPDSNATQQIVNCHCPKQSVTYLLKKLPYTTPSGQQGNQYQFACSPQSVSCLQLHYILLDGAVTVFKYKRMYIQFLYLNVKLFMYFLEYYNYCIGLIVILLFFPEIKVLKKGAMQAF